MKKDIDVTKGTITFTFDGLEPVVLNIAKVSTENREYAALFGLMSNVGDKAAIQKSAENGFKVTEEMRRAEVVAGVAHFESGSTSWTMKAKARAEPLNPHIQAIAEKRNCTYGEALAWFNEKLMAELAAD